MKKTVLILFVLGFVVSIFVGIDFWITKTNSFSYQFKIIPNFSLLDIAFLNSTEKYINLILLVTSFIYFLHCQ